MSKNNEPVKLVYPSQTGVSQPAVINMNSNRVTFTSQSIPNGTINLSTLTTQQQQGIIQTSSTGMTSVGGNASGLKTTAPQQQQQQPTLVIQKQGTNQNMTMMPGVQIVNMRPSTPTAPTQQKTVATVSPRVVIGSSHMVGARPGQANSITLSQLQNIQATGPPGQAILLKTENGQFQLLRVGPSPVVPGQQNLANQNQTIRLQTVPAQQQSQTIVSSAAATSIVVNSVTHTAPIQATQPSVATPPVASVAPVPSNATPANQQNTKEKCRKFLANLLELSSREPKPVEKNVRTLIQELIDANVEPEEFCDRLERLLNASPQPCLIGFLKKSLPLLRQSLVTKELVIEGIRPPPHHIAFTGTLTPNIPAQVRPIGQAITSTGQAQVRMVQQIQRPIGQTTITRHTAPVRIHGPIVNTTTNQRINNATTISQIRPSTTTIVQTTNMQQNIPALQPVSAPISGFTPGGAQIRPPPIVGVARAPAGLQIRQATATTIRQQVAQPKNAPAVTHMKVGSTQIKQITANSSGPASSNASLTPTTPTPTGKALTVKTPVTSQASSKATTKDKDKKAASSSFYQNSMSSMSSSMYGDDDINDVAAMGGVNLAEESQRILGSTELIGTQIRSCKDEVFLHLPALQQRIRNIVAKHGLEEPSNEVNVLISHATQERLKNIVEKLAVIAEHRIDIIKVDPRYEVTKDVRGQIKFLEELDKAEQKRHEEQEREMLMRAAKSRSKTEDPEQAKLKAKAKEMQRAEMEELRQRDANLTALQAIGPRKKPRLEGDTTTTSTTGATGSGTTGNPPAPLRPRIKRVNLKDMIFYLEQERETCRSSMLYKAYLK
ncbi:transcription initiation factor TFIID subunit 4 isoform X3 [Bradysia coprophila]|nr:transcription initiation factor TFIID subunit 4 isoform X3 [Bradysia coprophila]